MNQNMMNSGMNPDMMNPNMMNPDMMNSGMNPNMMNPNMMNPNMMNSGMMNSGMMNSGITGDQQMGSMNQQMMLYNPSSDGTSLKDMVKSKSTGVYARAGGYGSTSGKIYSNDQRNDRISDDEMSEHSEIRELANSVNHSLRALEEIETIKKKKRKTESDRSSDDENNTEDNDSDDDNTSTDNNKSINKNTCMEDNYGMLLIEPIILLSLYVIMTQPFMISFISGYSNYLKPNEDGEVGMIGVIIYGSILTILFLVLRKVIYSRL